MSENKVELQDCWNEAAPAIKEAIGEQDYSTWFSRVFFDSQDGETLVLKAGTKLVLDSVQNRFASIITDKVSETAGFPVGIKFVLKRHDGRPATEQRQKEKGAAQASQASQPAQAAQAAQTQQPAKKESKARGVEMLNPAYTFESFVPGDNSVFAYNACKAISENPGGNYNPCLIYGGVGLGKTHLIQAIGNHIVQNSKLKVQYITSENFINEFINSVNSRTMQQFKNKYRRVHVLLIDDIQFLENKKETQAELFNTFNDLYDTGRQIVFTCDRPVNELKDISDRLRNRFERGLSIDIQPPEYETRLAIIRHKCAEKNFFIGEDILAYVAENVQTNVRDLEACLTKLVAYGDLINKDISIDVAKELLKNSIRTNIDKSTTSVANIIKCVADYFGISSYDIKGKSKKKSIANARQIAMYLARKQTDYSTTEIGIEFGGRDHTTIMYAIQKIESLLTVPNSETQALINQIITILKAGNKQ